MKNDLFISHATPDKEKFVRPLVVALIERGVLSLWYDEFNISVGNSISEAINKGLKNSRYFVVIISPDYIKRYWTGREFNGAQNQRKRFIPILHEFSVKQFENYSFGMSDILCLNSSIGPDRVAEAIVAKLREDKYSSYYKNLPEWNSRIDYWVRAKEYIDFALSESIISDDDLANSLIELFYFSVDEIRKIRKAIPFLTEAEATTFIIGRMKDVHFQRTSKISPYTEGLEEVERKISNYAKSD